MSSVGLGKIPRGLFMSPVGLGKIPRGLVMSPAGLSVSPNKKGGPGPPFVPPSGAGV